jgi:hypothetical protein
MMFNISNLVAIFGLPCNWAARSSLNLPDTITDRDEDRGRIKSR